MTTEATRTIPKDAGTPLTDDPPAKRRFGAIASGGGGSEGRTRPRVGALLSLKPYVLRYRLALTGTIVALVIAALATLVLPLGVRRMIDFGFAGGNGVFIDRYFLMMMMIGLVLAVSSAARYYAVSWLGERVVADLSADVFQQLTRLGPGFYDKTHSGEVMSRLTADTTQIKSAIGAAISQTLRNLVLLIGALVMMFVTSAKLSLLVLLAIPLVVLPLVAYGRTVKALARRAQDWIAESSAFAGENLASVRTMQAMSFGGAVAARFREAVERSFGAARSRIRARAALTAVAMALVFGSVVAVLWYGASEVLAGTMTGGRLGQFVLYAVFAAGALGALSEVWGEIAQASGAAERLTEILRLEPEIRSPANPIPMPAKPQGCINFDDVTFRYAGRDEPALAGVNLSVRPGETVAIVGPSGAGKTTLFNLLLRFYDPQAGAVRIDGIDVKSADLEAVRRSIALVPQEIAIFADTVAANIAYGAAHASRAEIEAAAEAAQARGFIGDLPDGFDARLGERGVTLSGGQRQRLAIARAMLRDSPILLLDEATSALDAESEAKVQRALERVMSGRTTLVIAHRLATVERADRIIVLDQGRIVEEGKHAHLRAAGGLYSRLSELQFRAGPIAG